jgi:hypothetical protein
MTDIEEIKVVGKTRWRRMVLVLVPAYLTVAALVFAAISGVLAVGFTISGIGAKTSIATLQTTAVDANGQALYQYGIADITGAGTISPEISTVIPAANLTNLCQSVTALGVTVTTRAGTDPANPVKATQLVVDARSLNATSATFNNFQAGVDLHAFGTPQITQPVIAAGTNGTQAVTQVPAGTFGQTATGATLTGVQQTADGTSAATFTLPGLAVSLALGSAGCF